ncbi:hypothetical protein NSA47_14120 [Irregularibacter muris]|uniref:DUF5673 domain-containing protein n=1 Tax=Irregularibacter muris TaxID=1796619 RepID=A0AAE3HH74_9FIRM|nr:hypothetical protein [Irregularibacter muris]MCR1900101.1 hypothetical protein [Irregularibacter muris]
MDDEIVVYGLLLFAFIAGSIYHFRIRRQCIHPIRLTKPRMILSSIILFIFCFIAYIGGNVWHYYILALAGAVFIISGVVAEGIHEKGIYYGGVHGIHLKRLAKWEDIEDIKIDTQKNKLQSFKLKTTTIYPGQFYSSQAIHEIKKLLKR